MGTFYPGTIAERNDWILARRGSRNPVVADRPYAFFVERERTVSGTISDVATIFLTNRECPWKCIMCDLWRNTTTMPVPPGSISRQIQYALSRLPPASVLKLYNSGSFFDSGAIPRGEWNQIAKLCDPFNHVVVECHPRLINDQVARFAELLHGTFEVAMGLETSHPEALGALNKGISVRSFSQAAFYLVEKGICLRTFLLVHPPFIPNSMQKESLRDSIKTAFDCGSSIVSLIPTRIGNGALDDLQREGPFSEPTLLDLEEALENGLSAKRGLVFADVWDLPRFARCGVCLPARTARLASMNLTQVHEPRIYCSTCDDWVSAVPHRRSGAG